jgi:hypothetical protein
MHGSIHTQKSLFRQGQDQSAKWEGYWIVQLSTHFNQSHFRNLKEPSDPRFSSQDDQATSATNHESSKSSETLTIRVPKNQSATTLPSYRWRPRFVTLS